MNTKEDPEAHDFDPDAAPDLSGDGWPERFAAATVRRERLEDPNRRGVAGVNRKFRSPMPN